MSQGRREEIEAWWPLIARIGGFILGSTLGSILVLTKATSMWPYLLVIGLCGPTVAISISMVLEAARGGGASGEG